MTASAGRQARQLLAPPDSGLPQRSLVPPQRLVQDSGPQIEHIRQIGHAAAPAGLVTIRDGKPLAGSPSKPVPSAIRP